MQLIYLLPYLIIVATLLMLLLLDAFTISSTAINWFSIIGLIASAGASYYLLMISSNSGGIYIANNMLKLDRLTLVSNIIIMGIATNIIIASVQYIKNIATSIGEYYSIFLVAILGIMIMIAADHVLMLYLGLEALSLALLGLIVFKQQSNSIEAAMKFFILNAVASSVMLFGVSILYLATKGSLYLSDINQTILNGNSMLNLTALACVLILTGIFFKFGIFPFHTWLPDVYQSSPYNSLLLIATIGKVAATIFAVRFIYSGLYGLMFLWQPIMLFLGLASIAFGNIVALAQTNIKRLLGYSAIANSGFIILAIAMASPNAVSIAMFYILSYSLSLMIILIVLMIISQQSKVEIEKLWQLQGLYKQHQALAALFALSMFAVAGLPPLLGFFAKLSVIQQLIFYNHYQLTILLVLLSLIGTFVYLRVVKTIYFMSPSNTVVKKHRYKISIFTYFILIKSAVLLILLSILPNYLFTLLMNIFKI